MCLFVSIFEPLAQNEGWNANITTGALANILNQEVHFRMEAIMLNVKGKIGTWVSDDTVKPLSHKNSLSLLCFSFTLTLYHSHNTSEPRCMEAFLTPSNYVTPAGCSTI